MVIAAKIVLATILRILQHLAASPMDVLLANCNEA